MSGHIPTRTRALRRWAAGRAVLLALALALAVGACGGEGGDPAPFLGTWSFREGEVKATCVGMRASQPLAGIAVQIDRGATADLALTTGACRLAFDVEDARRASAAAGQTCMLVINGTAAVGRPRRWTLELDDTGTLTSAGVGTADVAPSPGVLLPCESFEASGTLQRAVP